MSARWSERQDGRNRGRADAGEGGAIPCALLGFALTYLAIHTLVWLGSVILP